MNTDTSAPPSAGATPTPTSPAEQGATLLVVDDDRTTRAMVRAVLARERFRIVEAADGEEAVWAAVARRPDLILLDVMMPSLDGHAACACIRAALRPGAPSADIPRVHLEAAPAPVCEVVA